MLGLPLLIILTWVGFYFIYDENGLIASAVVIGLWPFWLGILVAVIISNQIKKYRKDQNE